MQQQGLSFFRRYVPRSTFPTSECVTRINPISRQNEGLPYHASTSSLTHKAKFPILRSQKRSPYHLSDCHPAHDREDQHLLWLLRLQGQLRYKRRCDVHGYASGRGADGRPGPRRTEQEGYSRLPGQDILALVAKRTKRTTWPQV